MANTFLKSHLNSVVVASGGRGAIGGKTGKTAVLPGFCQIEHGGGPPLHVIGVLSGVTMRAALVVPLGDIF